MSKKDRIELLPMQIKFIEENWKTMLFDELVKKTFVNDKLDGRNAEGKAVKDYLLEKHGDDAKDKLKTKTNYIKKEEYFLSDDEKKFLLENYERSPKPSELTNLLFGQAISNLDKRYKAVVYFLKDNFEDLDESSIPADSRYNVPRSLDRLVPKVNEYLGMSLTVATLSPDMQRKLSSLLGYMQIFRFSFILNQFSQDYQRKIFEESFIRYTWDKTDLNQEEVDLYITLCDEIVNSTSLKQLIKKTEDQISELYDSDDKDARKLGITTIELINSLREKQDKSQARCKQLADTLAGSRAKRLNSRQVSNASIINLVDAWKDQEKRNKILELAKREKLLEDEEVDRLETLDEMKAFIVGLSKEEAKHG